MSSLLRASRIVWTALYFGLDEFLLPRARELGVAWLFPAHWRRPATSPRGERLRHALEDLGPVFVKLGQLLSVRPDLVPVDVADALGALRDDVAPSEASAIRDVLERAYARPVGEVFETFEFPCVASASIAQVHRARLRGGRPVAVKVVRPGIRRIIARDLALLERIAGIAERLAGTARRLRALDLVAQYGEILQEELDMLREAANASQLARNFEASSLLRIPAVDWSLTRSDVLVLEYVSGIPIDRVEALEEAGIDRRELAEHGIEVFFKQVFEDNFFHADMHPGNIFVEATDEGPRYLAVDFGIVGTLGQADLTYLAENFFAFFRRDYRRVAELHVVSGWVPPGTGVEAFESAIRTVCEPIFERPLAEISFGNLLVQLFRTAQRFDMQVQPQLFLLQKTLLHIEGLGRMLYPELDLWRAGRPFFERWMARRTSPSAMLRAVYGSLPAWAALVNELGPVLPDLAARSLRGSLLRDAVGREPVSRRPKPGSFVARVAIVVALTGLAASGYGAAVPFGAVLALGLLAGIAVTSLRALPK